MASHPFSNLRFIIVDGTEIDAPREWVPALVEVLVPADEWEQVQLWYQDQPVSVYLQRLNNHVRVLADWPRSGPGQYRLTVKSSQLSEQRTILIQPAKISRDAYTQLLADLDTYLPATIAFDLQKMGALSGIKLLPPEETTLAQEWVRLRRAVQGSDQWPGLVSILHRLAHDPHQILRATELWTTRDRARRPHPARLPQAFARGHNLDDECRPHHMLDTRVEHTVDVYENRLVHLFVYQVELRLRRLIRALEAQQDPTYLNAAQQLLAQLHRARHDAAFLKEVSLPAHLPVHLTMVLLNRPAYRAAFEGYLDFHRRVAVQLDEPASDAPLAQLPYLYQHWGTLMVMSVLLDEAAKGGYAVREQRLIHRERNAVYVRVLPDGKPAAILHHPTSRMVIRLIPERTYHGNGLLHSISYPQRPDMAIEIERPTGITEVYLFDPKYKLVSEEAEVDNALGLPKKIDIDKMHAYRDAIRDDHDRRVVQYAATLYPGQTIRYAPGLAALRAYPVRD